MTVNKLFYDLAEKMFKEYNEVAMEYEIQPFYTVDEVAVVLEDNITEDDAARLEQDDFARMALAGFISALLLQAIDDEGYDATAH